MNDSTPDFSRVTAEEIVAELQRLKGSRCPRCQAAVCHHQVLANLVMGFRQRPRCLTCLGASLDWTPASLRRAVFDYVQLHECYRAAWSWANQTESTDATLVPSCLLTREESADAAPSSGS